MNVHLSILLGLLVATQTVQAQTPTAPAATDSATPQAPRAEIQGQVTREPKLLQAQAIELPAAVAAEFEGQTVVVELPIDADGRVVAPAVTESVNEVVDQAVLQAVSRFQFEPAEVDHQPAAVRIKYRYTVGPATASAQVPTETTFSGSVREKGSGSALGLVRIELDGKPAATTNERGEFTVEHVTPGTHTVTLSGSRFVPLGTQETIETGTTHSVVYEVEIVAEHLAADEVSDLEIVVNSSRLQKSVTVTSVSAEQGAKVAGTGGDAIKVIENLPGVARSTAGSGQVVVWGASAADTRVYVDGIRIPTLYHQGGFRSVIHSDLVGSVELVPGGYGASYGRGLGGLITVVKRTPADDHLHGSVQLDVLDASGAVQGPIANRWRIAAAARRSHLHWVLARATSEDVGEFFPIPRYSDAQASVRYLVNEHDWVEVGGLVSSDSVAHTLASSDPAQRKEQTQSLYFDRMYARYTQTSPSGVETFVVPWLGRDQSSLTARFGGTPTALTVDSMNYGLRAGWRGDVAPFLVASLGLDLEATSASAHRAGSISSPPREGDAHIFGQPPSDQVNADDWSSFMGSAAPYVEGDFGVLDKLHVIPGIRLEPYFTSVSRRTPPQGDSPAIGAYLADFSLQPRLAVKYTPSRRVTYKAAFGQYRQQPAATDLSPVFGNPLLGPAQATHWLAGVSVRLSELLTAESTVFYTHAERLAVRNPAVAPVIAQGLVSQGRGRAYGMQILLRRELAKGLFGWVAYTLLRSERSNGAEQPWRPFDFDQTHVLTALASYDLGRGFELGSRFRYATGYPRTPVVGAYYDLRRDIYDPVLGDINSIRIPAFVQFDIRLAKRWKIATTDLEVYADVQNVTNRHNQEELVYSADYSAQRSIRGLPFLPVLGAKWSF